MPPAATTPRNAPSPAAKGPPAAGLLDRVDEDVKTRRWPRHKPTPTPQTTGKASIRLAQEGSGSRSAGRITSRAAWILASSRRDHMPSPRRAPDGPGMAGLPGPVARHDPCADGHWTARTMPRPRTRTGAEDRQTVGARPTWAWNPASSSGHLTLWGGPADTPPRRLPDRPSLLSTLFV